MKTLLSAVALIAVTVAPAAALAQAAPAAAAPAAAAPAVAVPPAAAQAPSAADMARVAAHEAALRVQIAGAQAGTMVYDAMTPTLAEGVRAQEAAVLPLFQQFGALTSVQHVGAQNGSELFLVTFANVVTQWMISLDSDGKVNGMLFRPAPSEDSGS